MATKRVSVAAAACFLAAACWRCGEQGGEEPAGDSGHADFLDSGGGPVADGGLKPDAAVDAGSDGVADAQVDAGGDSGFDSGVADDTGGDAGADDGGPEAEDAGDAGGPTCGSGAGALPPGLVELAWDDGKGVSNVREQAWAIDIGGTTYMIRDQVLHEAVRFDLAHPARIHGFSIMWAKLPAGTAPDSPLVGGLYPDFGHNGFDFWAPDPYWLGDRCAGDAVPGEWTTYVFDKPIEIGHPGLVYVAHRIEGDRSPAFMFDATYAGNGECAVWDECHSAMNMPEVAADQFFNGLSLQLQYDYLVRLHVEYTEQLAPDETIFAPQGLPVHKHVSFGDYNDDGFDDMLTDGPVLWRNNGDGTFADVTESSGISAMALSATGGVWGDYDNDGCLDLFLFAESYTAADTLLRSNCDGTFSDATAASGIVDHQTYNPCGDPANNIRSPTAAAAWVDLDSDGFLDLYLANMSCWGDAETYYIDTVFRNNGDGTFAEWTGKRGFVDWATPSRGVSPADHDGDGDVDVYVVNYRLQANFMFVNNGDGTVSESAEALGLAGVREPFGWPYYGHSIGGAWGDPDNDGDLDLVVANLAHPRFFNFSDKTQVLIHNPGGTYDDISGDWSYPKSAAGLRYQETHSVPALSDFDNNGNLDLVITAVYDGRPTDFYWGNGDGTFRLDAYHAGITTENGWGVATADVNNDGLADIFADDLFINRLAPERRGHWLQVRAVGNAGSNRAAIGATVRVAAGGKTYMRHVQGGTGKGGQDSQYLHFGLGAAAAADSISVVFPGGKKVDFAGPFAADQRIWVYEDGTTFVGWSPGAFR
jgi:hypothetical protein